MTAIALADIPSNINTYERLHVWTAQCLQSTANGKQTNVVANAASQPTAQVQLGVTADNVPRFIITSYVPYDLAALNDPEEKTWMAAKDISDAQPNENLLSN